MDLHAAVRGRSGGSRTSSESARGIFTERLAYRVPQAHLTGIRRTSAGVRRRAEPSGNGLPSLFDVSVRSVKNGYASYRVT
ncbi:hypothetical protein FRAHR75_450055 [Frankia sp. Hr75.2]|nr:hypothetical protein FRAHR75_450055 [Frankia sp. Hr75.2]